MEIVNGVSRTSLAIQFLENLMGTVFSSMDEIEAPGNYRVEIDAFRLASGIYFYRIEAGEFGQARKMMVLR